MQQPSKMRARQGRTATPDEIARFEAIAREWWDPTGKFRPLHALNPLRLSYSLERLAHHYGRPTAVEAPLSGLTVLDVGCGGGLMSEGLARLGAMVTAIDASTTSVAVARHHAQSSGLTIEYACALPEDLAAAGRTFDAVVAMEVIEHVANIDAFVAAIAALTRPGGALLLATLNRTAKSLLLAKVGAEYVLRWLPIGTHDWRNFLRPSELARLLDRHDIDLRDLRGMSFDLATEQWSMTRDVSVNYVAYAVRG